MHSCSVNLVYEDCVDYVCVCVYLCYVFDDVFVCVNYVVFDDDDDDGDDVCVCTNDVDNAVDNAVCVYRVLLYRVL